jgi:hypothetical protein
MFLKVYYFLKYFCFFGSFILLGFVIYYIKKLELFEEWKKELKEKFGVLPLPSVKNKKWQKIEKLLKEEFPSSWKIAIIESLETITETLKSLGYKGKNFSEILEELKNQGFRNLEILEESIKYAQLLIDNPQKEISLNEARKNVLIFKKFYEDLLSTII